MDGKFIKVEYQKSEPRGNAYRKSFNQYQNGEIGQDELRKHFAPRKDQPKE